MESRFDLPSSEPTPSAPPDTRRGTDDAGSEDEKVLEKTVETLERVEKSLEKEPSHDEEKAESSKKEGDKKKKPYELSFTDSDWEEYDF